MRMFATAVLALVLSTGVASADWDIDAMNEQIEKTNIVVGGNCSGTIIDTEARIILTAYHCITGQIVEEEEKEIDPKTGEIRVRKVQRRKPLTVTQHKVRDYEVVSSAEYMVSIAGIDAANDIAILQVTDTDFKPERAAPLASDRFVIRRGIKVYAVGNPNVVWDNSITEGIVSSPQRTLEMDGRRYKFFQHSASIIGGNSGGSILNEDGELIGTVSAGVRGANIGFAVPISFTKALLRSSGFGKVLGDAPLKPEK